MRKFTRHIALTHGRGKHAIRQPVSLSSASFFQRHNKIERTRTSYTALAGFDTAEFENKSLHRGGFKVR